LREVVAVYSLDSLGICLEGLRKTTIACVPREVRTKHLRNLCLQC
jgi:hypothetical protein